MTADVNPEVVTAVVSGYGSTSITPYRFFLAWNSVLTLAYRGFSQTLLSIKQDLLKKFPDLIPENPGSRWPKTTLGCLRDGSELTDEEVRQLRRICADHDKRLGSEACPPINIDRLQLVTFQCRSLEVRHHTLPVHLGQSITGSDDMPPADHLADVDNTMDQFSETRHEEYMLHLKPEGRTLKNWYRKQHREQTLISGFRGHAIRFLNPIINGFLEDVESAIPGKFGWFEEESRHITVRSLAII